MNCNHCCLHSCPPGSAPSDLSHSGNRYWTSEHQKNGVRESTNLEIFIKKKKRKKKANTQTTRTENGRQLSLLHFGHICDFKYSPAHLLMVDKKSTSIYLPIDAKVITITNAKHLTSSVFRKSTMSSSVHKPYLLCLLVSTSTL